MRVYGPNGTVVAAAPRAPRRAATGGFEVPSEAGALAPRAPATLTNVAGVALLALQEQEDPAQRRRSGIRRGRGALDALDALKLGLLSGRIDSSALSRLRASAGELTLATGDHILDTVLAEIELRVAVELAKFEAAPSAKNREK